MSSTTYSQDNHIVPRSILLHRPITTQDTPDVSPWVRVHEPSRHIPPQTSQARGVDANQFVPLSTSTSLATLVGSGMGIVLLLILIGQTAFGWASAALDDWRYGRPRTFQTDAYVGHERAGQPASHFIALNNQGCIEVIELPGNDATHARIFLGPQLTGANADLIPVTLQFVDPHHTHHPDMLVHLQQSFILFRNRQGTFQLQP